jgi:pyridoxine 5-phosphate synthase
MAYLSVNLDKIILLRNSRRPDIPDLAHLITVARDTRACGITVLPKSDERCIRHDDATCIADEMASWRITFELKT